VMYRGRIIGIVGPDTPREEIGLLMAGISPDAAAPGRATPHGEATPGTPAASGGTTAAPAPEGPGSEDKA
jgi:hypothetical protein